MSELNNPLGNIEVAPAAIATIASHAVLQSYGVVGHGGQERGGWHYQHDHP